MRKIIVLILIIIGLGYHYYDRYVYFEQLNASLEPVQKNLTEIKKLEKERDGVKFYIEPKAEYDIQALLISKEKYSSWDIAKIVPYDLALAWGDLAKKENIKSLNYGQRLRHVNYTYSYSEMKLSPEYIQSHISNNHIIPANEEVYKKIKGYKVNRIIHLRGYLVKLYVPVSDDRGFGTMDSSMIRTDTGDGACEIIYVEDVW